MMDSFLSGFLLLSECCILSTCLLRQYHFVDQPLTWTEAQTYCRQTYTDLASVGDSEERKQLLKNLSSAGYNSDFWIGLYTEIDWRWSDGFTGNGADYRNWDIHKDEPNFYANQFCVASGHAGWSDQNCRSSYPFICYNGTQVDPEFVFVNEAMDWSRAQRYCRENHVDLATVKRQKEDQMVHSLVPSGSSAWIGLFRYPKLYWSDGSRSTFSWITGPNPIGSLKVMCSFRSERWGFASCEKRLAFICHGPGRRVKQQVVKLRLKLWDSMNDPALKGDLLKKLQDRLEKNGVTGVTLKWREQPDGKVFYKEGKRKKTEL